MTVSRIVAASTDVAIVGLYKIASLPANVAALQTLDPKQKIKKGPKPPYVIKEVTEGDSELISGRQNVLEHISGLAEKSLSGSNAEERAAITQWQSYTQTHVVPAAYKNDDATTSTVLKHVETALTESAFIATPEVSVADVVLGAALAPFSTKFESKTKAWFLNLTRCSKGAIQPVSAAAKDKGIAKSGKAEKDAKKAEKKKEKPPAEPEKDPLSLVDVRVGHITECKAHPDADSLYVETMELGEEAPRTIISGLVKFQSLEQMIGRKVLVVCNMKPVKMRGISSEGMVLCASNEDHSVVEPLTVPDGCKPGDLVSFEGYERCPVPQMPPKKKIFEAVQPKLHVIDGKALYAKKVAMTTEHGPITCEKIPNATIS